jgi:hypothetical protein
MAKATAKKVASKAEEHHGVLRFTPPWLLIGVVLLAGWRLHTNLGNRLPDAPVAVVFITLSGVALSALTWRYALPRGPVTQWHAAMTVAAHTATLVGLVIFGVYWSSFWLVLGVGVVFALSWNIRRFEAIRGEGNDAHNKDVLAELGLTVKKTQVVTNTKDRKEVKLKLGDGQTVETVQKQLGALGSHAGALRKGTRAVPGEYEGEVTLSMSFRDVLKETLIYQGPTHPGGSIADGILIGLYEDAKPVWIYPAGNYEKNIAPGHTAEGGMPRSGKGATAHVSIAELSTRRDCFICLSDTRKGRQFLDPVEPAIGWYMDTENGVRAQLKAYERAMVARNKGLGDHGYNSWTPKAFDDPRLRMPAIVCWMEEAAAVLDDNARLIVELGEAMLSAGMFLVCSAQRWSADRVPTSFRTSIGNVLVFGQGDSESGPMLLSAATLEAGPDPFEWKTRFPGRMLVEGNGIEPDRFPVPAKGYFAENAQLKDVTSKWAPRMAPLDPITEKAFGEPYAKRTKRAAAVAVPEPTSTELEDDDDRPYQPTDEEEAQFMVPKMDDPELAAMAEKIDPRAPMPAWEGEDINLEPEPMPGDREWTPDEKRAEFGRMLIALMDAGRAELSMDDLRDEWVKRLGEVQTFKRAFLYELIGERIEQGQMERAGRGKYRLLTLVSTGQ